MNTEQNIATRDDRLGLRDDVDHETPARTVIVGGDFFFRTGLNGIFEGSEFHVEDAFDTVDQAIIATAVAPDLVIWLLPHLDYDVADHVVHKVRSVWRHARLVALCPEPAGDDLSIALSLRLDGLLSQATSKRALVQSLSLIMLGENVFPANMKSVERPQFNQRFFDLGLSAREADILACLTEGASNRTIARQLGSPEATIKSQIRQLLAKLNLQNRTQAALWAIEQDLVSVARPV